LIHLYRLHIWHRDKWVKGGYFFGVEDADEFLASFFDEPIHWREAPFKGGLIFVGLVDSKPAYYLLQEQSFCISKDEDESALPCPVCHKVFTAPSERRAQLALNAHMRKHKKQDNP
jgi:hypothetical protein